mmetsp:Transcript_94446/g.262296  ORF Transcript_94446/g.262296 Transcript_94446/m.262296 type:complete len:410 (-) Transcript_94446:15-1244(-)
MQPGPRQGSVPSRSWADHDGAGRSSSAACGVVEVVAAHDVDGADSVVGLEVLLGRYEPSGTSSHGEEVFAKTGAGGEPVFLYFARGRRREDDGWWFGPEVGGATAWCFAEGVGFPPPASGWAVPTDALTPVTALWVRLAEGTSVAAGTAEEVAADAEEEVDVLGVGEWDGSADVVGAEDASAEVHEVNMVGDSEHGAADIQPTEKRPRRRPVPRLRVAGGKSVAGRGRLRISAIARPAAVRAWIQKGEQRAAKPLRSPSREPPPWRCGASKRSREEPCEGPKPKQPKQRRQKAAPAPRRERPRPVAKPRSTLARLIGHWSGVHPKGWRQWHHIVDAGPAGVLICYTDTENSGEQHVTRLRSVGEDVLWGKGDLYLDLSSLSDRRIVWLSSRTSGRFQWHRRQEHSTRAA